VDHKGRPVGAVKAGLDVQASYNDAMSKQLWQASSNRWLIPAGTVTDMKKFRANAARPDGLLEYEADQSGAKPELIPHGEDWQIARELARDALNDLEQIMGSPDAFRGQDSQAVSGRAMARKAEGALRQQGIWFREEKRTMYQIGVMWRSMIAARVTDETIIRITQPNGQEGFAAVNVQDPLRRQQLEAQGYQVHGSIGRLNFDTKVIVSPLSATIREKQAAEQEMVNQMLSPEQLAAVSDIRLLATDIKDKEKMAERIAQLRMPAPMPGAPMGPDGMPVPPPGGPPPGPAPQGPPPPQQPAADHPPAGFPLDAPPLPAATLAGEAAVDPAGGLQRG
jgi:hypothetical protein